MGPTHVVIQPGGASETLKPGGEIENTQGAVDVFSLISQFIRPQPGAGGGAADNAPAKPAGD